MKKTIALLAAVLLLLPLAACGGTACTVVEFTLHEGRNREIRKICAHHGYRLARLTRVSIGSITLTGSRPS